MNKSAKLIVKNSIVLSLYVILTIFLPTISFGPLQIRISELLMFLILIDYRYTWGLCFGVVIANLFSPLGLLDCLFGGLATLVFLLTMIFINNRLPKYSAILLVIFGTLYNSVCVSLEYYFILSYPFWLSFVEIIISESVILIIGYIVYRYISKQERLLEIIRI